jgi:hypothetical protein
VKSESPASYPGSLIALSALCVWTALNFIEILSIFVIENLNSCKCDEWIPWCYKYRLDENGVFSSKTEECLALSFVTQECCKKCPLLLHDSFVGRLLLYTH